MLPAARLLFTSHPDPDSLLNSPSATPQHCEQTWTHRLERNNSKLFPHLQSRKIFPLKEVIPDHESSLVSGSLKSGLFCRGRGSRRSGGGEAGRGNVFPSKSTALRCPHQVGKAGTWTDSHTGSCSSATPRVGSDGHGALTVKISK